MTFQLLVLVAIAPVVCRREYDLVTFHAGKSRRAGVFAVAGLTAGLLLQVALAIGVLSTVAAVAPGLVALVQAGGAAFLVLLGLQTLREVASRQVEPPMVDTVGSNPWEEGLLLILRSHRIWGIVFVAFPALMHVRHPSLLASTMLVAGVGLVSLTVARAGLIVMARRVASGTRTPVNGALVALSGGVLVGLGARVWLAVLS